MNLKDLQLYVFSGRGHLEQEQHYYEKCYETWKNIWKQTFLELDGNDKLYSDNFTRQDKILGLFYKDVCVAVAGLRTSNFLFKNSEDDSIFSSWNMDAIAKLIKEGSRVMVCSNLAVHPDYRGEISYGLTLKNLITYLATKQFLESDCDSMAGTARVNRGANKVAYSNGAHLIQKSEMHGVEVDLVAFYKSELINRVGDLKGDSIWNKRIDFTEVKFNKTLRVA